MRDQEREEMVATRHRRIGEWLEALVEGRGLEGLEAGELLHVKFRMPTEEEPMCLMIVQATDGGAKVVAFVGAPTPGLALLAWRKRDGGNGLKWRMDLPWSERAPNVK